MNDYVSLTTLLSEPCPVPIGSRIELISMFDDPNPIEPGSQGVVTGGNGAQIHVDWDNGRHLMLIPNVDKYKII